MSPRQPAAREPLSSMPTALVPLLLLGALPVLYLASRAGILERRSVRWALGGLLALALLGVLPWAGVDFIYIKRLNLLIASAAALVFALEHVRARTAGALGFEQVTGRGTSALPEQAGQAGGRLEPSRSTRGWIAALALLAALGWLNFFSFHGERTWIHLHDVAHYYLGARYHAELGYTDLYTAMLRAEAETHGDRFRSPEARDLESYDQVDIRTLLRRSDAVKARFSPERWSSFKQDVEFFRSRLGPQYGAVLLDHGFNPTTVWALLGGWLSNLVPPGSHAGILALTLIDPLLILAALSMAAWAFGIPAATLLLLHFCVIFGATFGWTGGAFMRQLWFLSLIGCACFLKKRRYAAAGASLALAAALRVFPVLFLIPPACKAAWAVAAKIRRAGRAFPGAWVPPRRWIAFFGGFAASLALLAGATASLPRGLGHWSEFFVNISTHVETISPNIVGLTEALAWRPGGGQITQEEFNALKIRRQRIYTAQVLLVFLPALALVGWLSRGFTDAGCLLLAMPLLLAGVSLASYYHVFLVLLVLIFRKRPRELALIFAAEALSYTLMLFEEREALLYVYRGIALGLLYAILLLDPARRQWQRLSRSLMGAGPLRLEP